MKTIPTEYITLLKKREDLDIRHLQTFSRRSQGRFRTGDYCSCW